MSECPMMIDKFVSLKKENYRLLGEEEAKNLVAIFREHIKVAFEIEAEISNSSKGGYRGVNEDIRNAPHNHVYNLKGDGSLNNGAELTIYGQPTIADSKTTYAILDKATKSMIERGYSIHKTCGGHMHILLTHNNDRHQFNNGMSIPRIVFANFYQLIRRFAPELTWLTSTMGRDGITRGFNYRGYNTLLRNSPRKYSPRSLRENQGSRYTYFNMGRARFDDNGDVKIFHVELRFPDGNLSSTALLGIANLFSALLVEAVKYSQYGLLSTGDSEHWARSKQLMGMFNTENRGNFTKEVRDELYARCRYLLKLVRKELKLIDGDKTYEIINTLAKTPIAYMINSHRGSWKALDEKLQMKAVDISLQKMIDKGVIQQQENDEKWIETASNTLKTHANLVRELIARRLNDPRNILQFNAELGTFVAV